MSKFIQDNNKSEIVLTSNLSVDFLRLLESEQHSDVSFVLGDEKINGEKKFASCFYFGLLITLNFQPTNSSSQPGLITSGRCCLVDLVNQRAARSKLRLQFKASK